MLVKEATGMFAATHNTGIIYHKENYLANLQDYSFDIQIYIINPGM